MTVLKRSLILITAFVVFSCGNDSDEKTIEKETTDLLTNVQLNFNDKQELDPVHKALLEELDICNSDPDDTSSYVAKCSAENFILFPVSDKISVKDAFLLQTKAGIVLKGSEMPLPVRHLMIFERENGELVRLMGIRGELISFENSNSEYKDIYAAIYYKKDDTMFNCKFSWDGSVYVFSVESLDWGEGPMAVKDVMKDSVSTEVYKDLREAKLLF